MNKLMQISHVAILWPFVWLGVAWAAIQNAFSLGKTKHELWLRAKFREQMQAAREQGVKDFVKRAQDQQ